MYCTSTSQHQALDLAVSWSVQHYIDIYHRRISVIHDSEYYTPYDAYEVTTCSISAQKDNDPYDYDPYDYDTTYSPF